MDCKELALKKVRIEGNVLGKFGMFEINQTFKNNTNQTLEVEYTFPIIETAAIVDFEAQINDKVLKGVCKEKEEAQKEYQENIVKGNSAYLMQEETPNVFKISLGKIASGEEIKIKIKCIDTFEMVDNKIKVIIPTLVTPRYASNVTDKLTYGKVDYTVDFYINIDKSINKKSVYSPSHNIKVIDDEKIEVLDYDMSKDFKLEIELKNELTSNGTYSTTRDNKKVVCLSYMPEILDKYADEEKEYLFIVDISGSMYGSKLDQTKNAVIQCLHQLDEGDKFNIIPFDHRFSAMSVNSLEYNGTNLEKATEYVNSLEARGGTEILRPIMFSLYGNGSNKTILLFTDGQVGNEEEITQYVKENIGKNRLFAFGIDSNVNSYFIKEISNVGNGKAELIGPGERIDDAIIRTFARIQTPMLENLKIDYGRNKVLDEIKENENLFNYEFYNVFAKLEELEDDIKLKGNILDKEYEWTIKKEDLAESKIDLELVFAKLEIDRLEKYIRNSRYLEKTNNYKKIIINISTKYNINSKYTSYIIVHAREDKIFDVPQYQNTTLSDEAFYSSFIAGGGSDVSGAVKRRGSAAGVDRTGSVMQKKWDVFGSMMNTSADTSHSANDLDIPSFLRKRKTSVNEDLEKLKREVYEYYKEFINKENKDILTYILFALYYIRDKDFNINDLIRFLNNKKEEIKANDIYMKLIIKLYNSLEDREIISKRQLCALLNDDYQKILYTGMKLDVDLDMLDEHKIKKILRKDKVKENIDKVVWYLCEN